MGFTIELDTTLVEASQARGTERDSALYYASFYFKLVYFYSALSVFPYAWSSHNVLKALSLVVHIATNYGPYT